MLKRKIKRKLRRQWLWSKVLEFSPQSEETTHWSLLQSATQMPQVATKTLLKNLSHSMHLKLSRCLVSASNVLTLLNFFWRRIQGNASLFSSSYTTLGFKATKNGRIESFGLILTLQIQHLRTFLMMKWCRVQMKQVQEQQQKLMKNIRQPCLVPLAKPISKPRG